MLALALGGSGMWHTVFIVLHAAAATAALVAGVVTLRSGRLFGVYRWSLVGMAVALLPAVVIGWPDHDTVTRIAYVGLLVLAGVMLLRAEQARRRHPVVTGGPTAAWIDAVGFTLISLSDGFAIVAAIRSGVPGWGVALIAVGIVVAGHTALQVAKARFVRPAVQERAAAS